MRSRFTRRLVGAAAALALAGASVPAQAQDFINVLTGGTSGVYYPLGVALSKVFTDKVPGARPSVQATKASVENLTLLQQGKGEIGFTLGDSLALGWAGDEEAGFKGKLDKLRGITAIYPNYIQIVATKESGIKTLADLKGKRLSVGAPKSGTELNARAILQRRRPELQGSRQGRVSALRRIRRADEEPPARRDPAIGRPRRLSIRDLATSVPIIGGGDPGRRRRQGRRALREGHRSRRTPMRARPPPCRPPPSSTTS